MCRLTLLLRIRLLNTILSLYLLLHLILWASAASAEITTDGSLGAVQNLVGPNFVIDAELGQQHGGNLFHSFGRFNINSTESALFNGPNSVSNILGRVTEGSPSTINGLLRSNIPGANLWLLNPAGILFGENAQLDIQGSFHASTADYLLLEDGGRFDVSPTANSVLTIAPPSSFGFIDNNIGALSSQAANLSLTKGETLSLVGGKVDLQDSSLTVPGGTVQIAAIATAGEVRISNEGLQPVEIASYNTLNMTNSTIETSGEQTGSVYIRGGQFVMEGNSFIRSDNHEEAIGGTIEGVIGGTIDTRAVEVTLNDNSFISASTITSAKGADIRLTVESIELNDSAKISSMSESSGAGGNLEIDSQGAIKVNDNSSILSIATAEGAGGHVTLNSDSLTVAGGIVDLGTTGEGTGGNLAIDTNAFQVFNTDGQVNFIRTYSEGSGAGGDMNINAATSISINGIGVDESNRLAGISSEAYASGDVGDLTVVTPSFENHGGFLGVLNEGTGESSTLNIQVDEINMSSDAVIFNRVGNIGNGKNIRIQATDAVILDSSSSIAAFVTGDGRGADIHLETENLEILNGSFLSSITLDNGDGGTIDIQTDSLHLTNGGGILVDSIGSGDAGSLKLQANDLVMTGGFISAGTDEGLGGSIDLQAESIEITNGGYIDSSSSGDGNAGSLEIQATELVMQNSTITVFTSEGQGGSIEIETQDLEVSENGFISSTALGSGNGGTIDIQAENVQLFGGGKIVIDSFSTGQAGSLHIQTQDLLMQEGLITAFTDAGQGGSIDLQTDNIQMTSASRIVMDSVGIGDAGSLQINTTDLVMQESSITATTNEGQGGQIALDAKNITGTNQSLISTASFGGGQGGIVNVQADSIQLSEASLIDSNAFSVGNAGSLHIQTQDLIMTDGRIAAFTFSEGAGGNIDIDADNIHVTQGGGIFVDALDAGHAGALKIQGNELLVLNSNVSAGTSGGGNGGDIDIKVNSFQVIDGGRISVSTSGASDAGSMIIETTELMMQNGTVTAFTAGEGQGGNIDIRADQTGLSGGGGVFVDTSSSGNAGTLQIIGTDLSVEASLLSAGTSGEGLGGSIDIKVDNLDVSGGGGILVNTTNTGNAGLLQLQATDLILENGTITGFTSGEGQGGRIEIDAKNVEVLNSGFLTSATFSSGDGGFINIQLDNLTVADGGSVDSSAFSTGNAGSLQIQATELVAQGGKVTATTSSEGQGGRINIQVDNLRVTNAGETAGEISVGSTGAGNAGLLQVFAKDIVLQGGTISASTSNEGQGGDIQVTTNQLTMRDGALVVATSDGSGNAGNITFELVDSLSVENSAIRTAANQSAGGNIILATGRVIQLRNGEISAAANGVSTGNDGGNVTLTSKETIVLNNGSLIARANAGNGGNINLTAQQLLSTPSSLIDASSQTGIDGNVLIEAPSRELSGTLADLNAEIIDLEDLLKDPCTASALGTTSSFIVQPERPITLSPTDYQNILVPFIADSEKSTELKESNISYSSSLAFASIKCGWDTL